MKNKRGTKRLTRVGTHADQVFYWDGTIVLNAPLRGIVPTCGICVKAQMESMIRKDRRIEEFCRVPIQMRMGQNACFRKLFLFIQNRRTLRFTLFFQNQSLLGKVKNVSKVIFGSVLFFAWKTHWMDWPFPTWNKNELWYQREQFSKMRWTRKRHRIPYLNR